MGGFQEWGQTPRTRARAPIVLYLNPHQHPAPSFPTHPATANAQIAGEIDECVC
jgi:hypothetical protein